MRRVPYLATHSVHLLQTNIPEAIRAYELAYRSSAQREIKLLCLHEIGWCRLIQLDYGVAMQNFKKLKYSQQTFCVTGEGRI